ncbi:hypothetical protein U6A24_17510 [Aquimarina gracilis]|uniref:Redox-active disulfide protein 2 n=1 Tax=Aquimarina gracilis TaxID=874422 RepID=A0ABU5ZZE8_9FLAO|nr:hypothetical protein [Aquimarina gracilis]MEB3347277.1 hypothetical protein [Aquimarina gracilis]
MKKEELQDLTIEELKKKETSLKMLTGLLAGILFVLFVVTIYTSVKNKEFDPMLITAIALSAIIPLNYKQIKQIKAEIKQRET